MEINNMIPIGQLRVSGIAIIGIIAGLIFLGVWEKKKHKRPHTIEEMMAADDALLEAEPEMTVVHAKIVDMACAVESIGYQNHKLPKAVKIFAVRFETDDGGILEIPVSEEIYTGLEAGMSGTLTLSGDNIMGFELDENA